MSFKTKILLFFLLFLSIEKNFAQKMGAGLSINTYELARTKSDTSDKVFQNRYALPSFYFYKTYQKNTFRMEYFANYSWAKGVTQRNYRVIENGITFTKNYNANAKKVFVNAGATAHFQVADFLNEKFRVYIGLANTFFYEKNTYTPTSIVAKDNYFLNTGYKFSLQPNIEYVANKRLSFDLRWNQPSNVAMGVRDAFVDPTLPNTPNRFTVPFFDINLQLWQPNFEFGARYALASYRDKTYRPELPRLLKSPTGKYGFGFSADFSKFDTPSFDFYNKYTESYRILPKINFFHLDFHDRDLHEFSLNNLHFSQKSDAIRVSIEPPKDSIFNVRPQFFTVGAGYAYHRKIGKPETRFFNLFLGADADLYYKNYFSKIDTNKQNNLQYNKFGAKISFTPTILWKCSKQFFIETRLKPNIYIQFDNEKFETAHPNIRKRIDIGQSSAKFNYGLSLLDSGLELGIKYIFKERKRTIMSYDPYNEHLKAQNKKKVYKYKQDLEEYKKDIEAEREELKQEKEAKKLLKAAERKRKKLKNSNTKIK